jgi:hypothetical protein
MSKIELAPVRTGGDEDEMDGMKASPENVVTEHAPKELGEVVKGRSVGQLLIHEWDLRRPELIGCDGKRKLLEGKLFKIENGMRDDVVALDDLNNDSFLKVLPSLSLHLQSLFFGEIAAFFTPLTKDSKTEQESFSNWTLLETRVSLLLDINAPMTTLSPEKKITSLCLTTALLSTFSVFGIPYSVYVFGDREAIWKVAEWWGGSWERDQDLVGIVNGVRVGDGYGC